MGLKIKHAIAFIFIAYICWDNFSLAIWIILHAQRWLPALAQEQHHYPTWITIVFQSVESTIGSAELFCCYFALRGRERARRLMLRLLPIIYACFSYHGVKVGLSFNTDVVLLVFAVLVTTAVPFAAVFFFYTRASVIGALFSSGDNIKKT